MAWRSLVPTNNAKCWPSYASSLAHHAIVKSRQHRRLEEARRAVRQAVGHEDVKTILVRDTFHIDDRDCLVVVGDQDAPVRRGDTFESNRGVRVRVAALMTLARSDSPDQRAV